MSLKLDNLHKHYAETKAVDGVTVELEDGETLALLGPSGCGKSTLLRLIAGLEPIDDGRLYLDGEDITGLSPQKRRFGMVFQDYALFPHLNVAQNIAFGLVELGWSKPAQRHRVEELLSLVGLSGFERRRVQQLSGGQQQRVALARALAPQPEVLLLDEPLSNLDQALRESLKLDLKELLDTLNISAIYVTHDQSEAFALAERVAVMRRGRLEQVADREQLFKQPKTVWIARFLGHKNLYSRSGPNRRTELPVPAPALLRSDLVELSGDVPAEIRSLQQLGQMCELELFVPSWGITFLWEGFARELPGEVSVGQRIGLRVPKNAWVPLEEGS
jgi:ABC-type Fe3+/spermidine/putrescine transport system ATPase subunit